MYLKKVALQIMLLNIFLKAPQITDLTLNSIVKDYFS